MKELFDLSNARNVHLAWEWELEAIAKGKKPSLDLKSYEDCQLGLWLHGTGIDKYRDSEHINQLVDVHRQFHIKAEKIIQGMQQSRFDIVETALQEVRSLSQEIVFTLTAIEFNALQKQRTFSSLPNPIRRVLQRMFDSEGEVSTGNHSILEAGEARLTHFKWSQELLKSFRNRGRDVVLKPAESCALGFWIHNVGFQKHGELADLKRLDIAHKAFHQKAETSLSALRNHQDKKAGRAYESMLQHSLEVVYLITSVENRLQDSGSIAPPLSIGG
ncbi:MAG: CZB domain-containing protein [Magnetococcales bacterium]|nr:CZB domain-containing protein [Magnetococcales bacterium]